MRGWLLFLAVLTSPFLTNVIALAESPRKPVIFVCSDSTAKNTAKDKNGVALEGWGTPIAQFFDADKVQVSNVAHAGRSSLKYYNGDWPSVLPKIKSGDFLLLVFGINDGTTPDGMGDETRTGPDGETQHTYGWYIRQMASDAVSHGAHVYLLTVTTRNIWTNPKVKFHDATPIGDLPADYDPKQDRIERGTGGGRYTQWTKEVGQQMHLPVFDLTNFCADRYEQMGREAVNKLYSDHNHTYPPGAKIVAESIIAGLKAFPDSPFLPLLSEAGNAIKPADPKYIEHNLPVK